ncbi:MAG: PP2C family protein-serine/threonine phosphatase [Ignavibacteriales bacterium]
MQKTTNTTAQKNLYALIDYSQFINSSLELDLIAGNFLLTCFGKFHCTKGLILIYDEEKLIKNFFSKGFNCQHFEKYLGKHEDKLRNDDQFNSMLASEKLIVEKNIVSSGQVIGKIFLGEKLSKENFTAEDLELLDTLINISGVSIQNSLSYHKLREVNKELSTKINQLSSIFDLGKEFSSILEIGRVSKLLVFSILGQLLVTKFAVVICTDNEIKILDSKFDNTILIQEIEKLRRCKIDDSIRKNQFGEELQGFSDIGIELIVPMKIKSEVKGLILLGNRPNKIPFSDSDVEFIASVASYAIISIENSRLFAEALEKQRLEKDLEIAQNIQRNLLPTKIPVTRKFDIAAYNQSAKQIGGDYYDIVKIAPDKTLIAIADVSGKGVQAALLMANLQAFLKSITKQNLPIHDASNLINDLVSENTTNGSFITFFWGILDETKCEISYVNMGHNPPLIVSKNGIRKLTIGGMILGVMKTIIPYKSETVKLETDDFLVLFTDGVTEAMNINNEEYGDERFENIVGENFSLPNSKKMLDTILDDVSQFTEGAVQSDDLTIMVVKVR